MGMSIRSTLHRYSAIELIRREAETGSRNRGSRNRDTHNQLWAFGDRKPSSMNYRRCGTGFEMERESNATFTTLAGTQNGKSLKVSAQCSAVDLLASIKRTGLRRLASKPEWLSLQHRCAGTLQVGLIAPCGLLRHCFSPAGSTLENIAEPLDNLTPGRRIIGERRIIGDRPTFSLSVVHIQSQVQHPIKKAPLSFQFS